MKHTIAFMGIVLLVLSMFALTGCDLFKGGDNETVGTTVVSDQPIPLVVFDFRVNGPDALGRIKNIADPSNKGTIDGTWNYHYGVGLNMTNATITMKKESFFPDRVNLEFAFNWTISDPNLNFTVGKDNYILIGYDETTNNWTLIVNATDGYLETSFPYVTDNVTGDLIMYKLVLDPDNQLFEFSAYAMENCSQKDVMAYDNETGYFSFADYTGEVEIRANMVIPPANVMWDFITIYQNPMVGQYEQITEAHCRRDFSN